MSTWDDYCDINDHEACFECNVSVADLGTKYRLTIEEAELVQVWIDNWDRDPQANFDFFNKSPLHNEKSGFEIWLDARRTPRRFLFCKSHGRAKQ